ncbi:hypothetical protein KPL70_022804 [Citrus sinensis]|nr:hypothetical protein KPL70_022804 [Citrus sinensis]
MKKQNQEELQVLELNAGDSVRDAVHLLYKENVSGAPIADLLDTDATIGRFSDRYIGFIDFASIILWSLEQCEKAHVRATGDANDDSEVGENVFFTMLEQNPQVGQTKIGELAKSFLWDSFFPVRLDDTLFHVLLLLSKHPLQVVPVIERPDSKVIGFVTQGPWLQVINQHLVFGYRSYSVIQLLLRSDGLEWFDGIADKPLSEFRFENEDPLFQVYGDQSIAEAFRILGALRMRNSFLPRMDQPVTNKKTDTLKAAMKNLAETKSSFSFRVNDLLQATGLLTVRDMIIQFAPPCVDSSIHGCGFFESALEQTGCKMKNGTIICDH